MEQCEGGNNKRYHIGSMKEKEDALSSSQGGLFNEKREREAKDWNFKENPTKNNKYKIKKEKFEREREGIPKEKMN